MQIGQQTDWNIIWQSPKDKASTSLERAITASLSHYQETAGLKQVAKLAHTLVQLRRGMYNHICYDDILCALGETLLDGVFLGVAKFEDHATSPRRKDFGSIFKETG